MNKKNDDASTFLDFKTDRRLNDHDGLTRIGSTNTSHFSCACKQHCIYTVYECTLAFDHLTKRITQLLSGVTGCLTARPEVYPGVTGFYVPLTVRTLLKSTRWLLTRQGGSGVFVAKLLLSFRCSIHCSNLEPSIRQKFRS